MKKLTTTIFAALIGLALTVPAMAQNTAPAQKSTTTQSKDDSKDKKNASKKSSKKKSSKKGSDTSTTTDKNAPAKK